MMPILQITTPSKAQKLAEAINDIYKNGETDQIDPGHVNFSNDAGGGLSKMLGQTLQQQYQNDYENKQQDAYTQLLPNRGYLDQSQEQPIMQNMNQQQANQQNFMNPKPSWYSLNMPSLLGGS